MRLGIFMSSVLLSLSCTEKKRSVVYTGHKEPALRIEKLTIQTFETAYDRQEYYLDQRFIGYVGSNYLLEESQNDGHAVLPVWPNKLKEAPVRLLQVLPKKGYFPWYLYVSPKKFSRDEFEFIVEQLTGITKKQGPVMHQAYYLAGAVYFQYADLFEIYRAAGNAEDIIEINPEGTVSHIPDASNMGTRRFYGKLADGKISMKRYWVKDIDFSRFRDSSGRKLTEVYAIVLTEGM